MSHQQAFSISAAGMNVERLRVEIAAMNLANANTVAGVDGKLYQPLRVIAMTPDSTALAGSFSALVADQLSGPGALVVPTGDTPRQVLDPGHPLADAKGFVSQPSVDHATEMMTMMKAMRSYEANIAAMNTTRSMALKSLEIGGA